MTTLMQMPDGRLIRACFLFLFFNSPSLFFVRVLVNEWRERETTTATFFFLLWREFGVVSPLPFSFSLSLSFRTCEIESSSASSSFAHRFSTRTNVHNTHTQLIWESFSSFLHSAFWKKKHNRAANRLVKRGHGHFPRQRPTNFKHQRVHGYCWYHTHDARSSRIR